MWQTIELREIRIFLLTLAKELHFGSDRRAARSHPVPSQPDPSGLRNSVSVTPVPSFQAAPDDRFLRVKPYGVQGLGDRGAPLPRSPCAAAAGRGGPYGRPSPDRPARPRRWTRREPRGHRRLRRHGRQQTRAERDRRRLPPREDALRPCHQFDRWCREKTVPPRLRTFSIACGSSVALPDVSAIATPRSAW